MTKIHALLLALSLLLVPFTAPADEIVDINTADAAELARVLEGVGRARAEAIVEHREKFGPFTSVEELRYVTGIGASTVERNRTRMTTGGETRTAAARD